MNLDLIYGYGYNYFENKREPFRKIENLLNSEEIELLINEVELLSLKKKTNKKFLSFSLGFSAGVMIYISFVELFASSQDILILEYGQK